MTSLKQHDILKKYVEGIVRGYANSLVVISEGGLGKTETVISALTKFNLREKEHYYYISNYLTPKGLVLQLEKMNELQNPKILILDDAEYTLKNLQAIGILRGALWQMGTGRKVSWITSKETIEFNFTGKIIFLLNQLNEKDPLIKAFADRGLYYNMKLDNREIIALMKKRAKQPYQNLTESQRNKIIDFIAQRGINSKKLSLRILPKIYDLFRLSPNHWQRLSMELFN